MVEHPRESAPSARVASAVRTSGGRTELERQIDVKRSEAHAFRDVTSPTEAMTFCSAARSLVKSFTTNHP